MKVTIYDDEDMDEKEMKRLVGYHAADLIESGTKVGIGTGSTVFFFIERLIERVKDGLDIHAAYTSLKSKQLAEDGGITSIPEDEVIHLDITVDGADEINEAKEMIKGGGGALLREKIIASSSTEMMVIVDEEKCVKALGKHPLPIEVVPFCVHATIEKLEKFNCFGTLRRNEHHDLYITDNGNYILDANLEFIPEPIALHNHLITITGVVETGLFFDLAKRVIVGCKDGQVRTL